MVNLMKEGIIKEEIEYYKYGEDGPPEEIPITKEEYDKIMEEFKQDDRDPFIGPNVYSRTYKMIRLSIENIWGLVSVLSYDKGLNEFAVKKGYHPASGYPLCNSHRHNIEYRKKQIRLLGEEPEEEESITLGKERCSKCQQQL